MARRQGFARSHQDVSGADILTAGAHVFTLLDRGQDLDFVRSRPAFPRVLLHHHSVRALGQGGAGKKADAFAGAHAFRKVLARRHPADQTQNHGLFRPGFGDVRRPHGVAIHGGVIEPRQVRRCPDPLGRHAPVGKWEGNTLGCCRGDCLQDPGQGFLKLEHERRLPQAGHFARSIAATDREIGARPDQ